MIKKLFFVTLLIMFVLSACSGRGAEPTATIAVTDTQPPTAEIATTAAPAVTETLTPDGTVVTATPTVGTVGPTNPADCTNVGAFVADITIPDETSVAAGSVFTKTWRIANKGTCVWGPDYKLTYYSDERMSAPETMSIGLAYPGENIDISVNLTAPTSPGRHQANFVIKNTAGAIVKIGDDSRLWVVINVTVGGAGVASPTSVTATATGGTPASPSPAATFAAATLPVATLPGAMVPATAGGTSKPGTVSCLYSTDRTKLTEGINAVNAYRAEKGLQPFTVNPKLAQAAQKYAGDMACNKLSAHTGSDNSTPQTRVAATGYTAISISENVYTAGNPSTGQGAVDSWKTDATNNQNLLSTTFTEIGVGYASFNNSGYYVIVFAKP